MIVRKHVVAETLEEVSQYEVHALVQELTTRFGSRGLEFSLEEPSVEPPGVAAVISRQYPGFAMFNLTLEAISQFCKDWSEARGPTTPHEDLI
jgi:hypothetical protein